MQGQLEGKWIAIGAVIIIILNQVWSYVLAEPVAFPLIQSMGLLGGLLVFVLIISILSFFLGGILIGRLSPGVTIKEAGIASVIAIGVNVVVNVVQSGQFPGILGLAIMVSISYGLGVLGAKVGEAWQVKAEGAPREY